MKAILEQMKPIKGYEDKYLITNYGNVIALDYRRTGLTRELKVCNATNGYKIITLWKDGKGKTCKIHRLVGDAFLPNPDNKPQINHKDEDKTNNYVGNLEWCDGKYNLSYGTCIERRAKSLTNNPKRLKRVLQYTLDGKFIREWESATEAERIGGFDNGAISNCCNGRYKQYKGFIWKFYTPNYDKCIEGVGKPNAKRVLQYNLDGALVKKWDSTMEAGRNGFNQGAVSACCRGEKKQYKGYLWRYA